MDGPPRKKHISEAVVYANCEGLDDAKAKKTATNWFHQLPEEIIMQVIHSIRDKVSILILRQTCRQFKRLCEDPTLEYILPILLNKARSTASSYKYKHIFPPVEYELRIYESPDHDNPRVPEIRVKQRFRYCQLLWRDGKCSDCADLRRDLSTYEHAIRAIYQAMRCSGCKCDHPAFLFSRLERQKYPSQRICIGRQGQIPLCKHRILTYKDLNGLGNSMRRRSYTDIPRCYSCQLDGIDFDVCFRPPSRGPHPFWINVCKTYKAGEDLPDHAVEREKYRQPHCTCIHDINLLSGNEALPSSIFYEDSCYMPSCNSSACHFPIENSEYGEIWYQQSISYHSPTDPSWLVALDPDSYLSDSDELTRGLMWCRDPTCAITKGGRGLCVIFNQYDLPHPKMPLSSGHDGDELKFDEHARRPGLRKRDQHKRVTKCTPANARELP
ncbi:hypothetical protein PGQ11_011285 [Apiospora arundinis]|uniref:F-box domain-containing protein n=1 Tax=Apiospora arundinis TaxID=335852 RepID=A0ABR2HZ60_9PEZI